MIAALIEYFTDYEYDYRFYAMCDGANFSLLETFFIYIVFFLDVVILFATIAAVLYLTLLAIVVSVGAFL